MYKLFIERCFRCKTQIVVVHTPLAEDAYRHTGTGTFVNQCQMTAYDTASITLTEAMMRVNGRDATCTT